MAAFIMVIVGLSIAGVRISTNPTAKDSRWTKAQRTI